MIETYPYPTFGFWNLFGLGLCIFLCWLGAGIHAYLKNRGQVCTQEANKDG